MAGTWNRPRLNCVLTRPHPTATSTLIELGGRRIPLLEEDPDLATGLSDEDFEHARRVITAPVEVINRGQWLPPRTASPLAVGILIMSGFVVRELRLGESTRYAELLGPGDVLRPWQATERGLVPWSSSWRVLEECTIAGLGAGIARASSRWPEITAALTSRVMERSRRQADAAAISALVRIQDRMIVLFAHLAERFGHVTRDGILLQLPLTHELLDGMDVARDQRPRAITDGFVHLRVGRRSVRGRTRAQEARACSTRADVGQLPMSSSFRCRAGVSSQFRGAG